VKGVALIRRVSIPHWIMSHQFLKKLTNTTFCVKLGTNASDTCAMLSDAYGGGAMKKSGVVEWHKQFKEGYKNMEDYERRDCPQPHLTELMKMLRKCGIWCTQTFKYQPSLLWGNTEAVI
jgi:hypothetical protein